MQNATPYTFMMYLKSCLKVLGNDGYLDVKTPFFEWDVIFQKVTGPRLKLLDWD